MQDASSTLQELGRQLRKRNANEANELDGDPDEDGTFFFDVEEGDDDGPFGNAVLFDEEAEDEAALCAEGGVDVGAAAWGEDEKRDDGGSSYLFRDLLPVVTPGALAGVFGRLRNAVQPQQAPVASAQGDDAECVFDEFQRRSSDSGLGDESNQRGPPPQPRLVGEKVPSLDNALSLTASGKFEKRSPWWVEGWRSRSYVLRDGRLLYFGAERPDRPLGVLDFRLLRFEVHCCWSRSPSDGSVDETAVCDGSGGEAKKRALEKSLRPRGGCDVCYEAEPENWSSFYLMPKAFKHKVFAFRGPEVEIKELAAKIMRVITSQNLLKQPNGAEGTRIALSLKDFWRYPFVREAEFLERVESGDILLFRGKERSAAVTRAITGFAQYDHVAMMLRTNSRDVLILEATGRLGVDVLPWSVFKARNWHKCYDRLAYRKVYFPRTATQLLALQSYVCSVLGTSYRLNFNKLFVRKLSREFDEDGNEVSTRSSSPMAGAEGSPAGGSSPPANGFASGNGESGEPRTFFCSELLAACLKRCGVLAGARASSQYWPGSFSQHCPQALPLQPQALVGEEQIIVCD